MQALEHCCPGRLLNREVLVEIMVLILRHQPLFVLVQPVVPLLDLRQRDDQCLELGLAIQHGCALVGAFGRDRVFDVPFDDLVRGQGRSDKALTVQRSGISGAAKA